MTRTEYMREYTRKNKDRLNAQRRSRDKTEINKTRKAWRDKDPRYNMWVNAKNRAKRDGLPFEITKEDIVIPEYCPALGVKLEVGNGQPTDNSPSLDKIIPELGYVPGNIIVVSYKANSMKRNASIEELKKLVAFYERL